MQVYNDGSREFRFAITFGTMRKVKGLTGIDLGRPFSGTPPLLERLADDPLMIVETIGALCADQAGLTVEKFIEATPPAALPELRTKLTAELADFFQQAGDPNVAAVVSAAAKARNATMAVAARMIQTSISGDSETNSPGSSASTPPT